jgi:phosphatidate cytidylyltransferase
MALDVPVFLKRTASAIVFAIVMLAGLLWNEWAFLALIALIQVLCLREYFRLMKKIYPTNYWPSALTSLIQVAGLTILFLSFNLYTGADMLISLPMVAMLLLLFLLPVLLLLLSVLSAKGFFPAMQQAFTGILYIVCPAVMLLFMREKSILIPVSLILMIWTNDTMAYLVGSFIGKHPLSKISPKKTWEGTIGGAVLTIIGAAIWGYYSHYYTMTDWMALALCAAVAGNFGDLLESKLKRMADVKDSGSLMPGHGGALDRFDSLLVATPFAFCYAFVFMPSLPLVIF